jgi:hypothetical protein
MLMQQLLISFPLAAAWRRRPTFLESVSVACVDRKEQKSINDPRNDCRDDRLNPSEVPLIPGRYSDLLFGHS